MSNEKFNLKQAANYLGVTRQAIWVAMTKGRLEYEMKESCGLSHIETTKEALIAYKETKWDRQHTINLNGQRLHNSKDSFITLKVASEISNIPRNNLYYAVKHGKIAYERVGAQYIFRLNDVERYARSYWKIRVVNELIG